MSLFPGLKDINKASSYPKENLEHWNYFQPSQNVFYSVCNTCRRKSFLLEFLMKLTFQTSVLFSRPDLFFQVIFRYA
jgi:hypothetical protein